MLQSPLENTGDNSQRSAFASGSLMDMDVSVMTAASLNEPQYKPAVSGSVGRNDPANHGAGRQLPNEIRVNR